MVINVSLRLIAVITICPVVGGCAGMKAGGGDERCQLDAALICAQSSQQPMTINGQQADSTMREQMGSRTIDATVPIRNQSGEVIANAACRINAQHNTVVYASGSTAGRLVDKDLDYLRQAGYCKQ